MLLFRILFFKNRFFDRVKELFKSNPARYGVSPGYVECKTETIFGIASLGKKLAFDTEICYYFEYFFSKLGLFDRVKELFKSNRTRYGVSPGYVAAKTERIFGIACLGKKLAFDTEICYYFEYFFSKIGLFDRVKELFKSNQTRYGVSPGYVEAKTERIFGIACLGKKFVFQSEMSTYSLIRLFYFQKYRNFVGSRSCSNRTELGMEYPQGM